MNSPITFTTEQQAILDVLYENYINRFVTTASGTTSVTINATSGVATFSTTCAASPSFTQYTINNSEVTATSILFVEVYPEADDSYCAKVSVYKGNGVIVVTVNDAGLGNAGTPTIAFQILN